MPDVEIAAILLAGGAGARMGGPKALLRVAGETFLDRQIRLYTPYCRPVVAVLGHHAENVAAGIESTENVIFVLNPRPERGQLSSLQCGLRAVGGAALFTPVDSPGVAASTVEKLIEAWRTAPAGVDAVAPRQAGRNGHPVLAGPALVAALLALPAGAAARDAVHAHRARTLYVEVGDARIHWDIDTPEDYAAMEKEVCG